ncbi:MAG TPA: hypothetical protein VE954_24315 [Oligoflexus sp.]|uniref:hypothetical protein n=1 Tax=Oligoflexus sp. TaxID=1971216 RepID=UPI002D323950|nr:hypothetical protein [Oligoflexus sp.]HYX36240.1 hypothetical protein [Oligoflexus sp.]
MAPGKYNLVSMHALTEVGAQGKIGISYIKGEDQLSVFHEQFIPTAFGYNRYASDRLSYQMMAVKYQYPLQLTFG